MGQQAARKDYVNGDNVLQSSPTPRDRSGADRPGIEGWAETPGGLDPLIEVLARAVDRLGAARSSEPNTSKAS